MFSSVEEPVITRKKSMYEKHCEQGLGMKNFPGEDRDGKWGLP